MLVNSKTVILSFIVILFSGLVLLDFFTFSPREGTKKLREQRSPINIIVSKSLHVEMGADIQEPRLFLSGLLLPCPEVGIGQIPAATHRCTAAVT